MREWAVILTLALADPATAAPLRLSCTVEGAKLLVPATAPPVVCERMRAAMAKAMKRPVALAAAAPVPGDRSDGLHIALRFAKPGIASARTREFRDGREIVHPDANVAVSDRSMNLSVVDLLARTVARAVDGTTGRR